MKNFLFLLGAILISAFFSSISFGEKKEYEVWLSREKINSQLEIIACCKNNTTQETKIILKVIAEKNGKTGKSKTIQSNGIILKANEKKCSSQIVFNISKDDNYQIILEAYKDDRLIAKDFITNGTEND